MCTYLFECSVKAIQYTKNRDHRLKLNCTQWSLRCTSIQYIRVKSSNNFKKILNIYIVQRVHFLKYLWNELKINEFFLEKLTFFTQDSICGKTNQIFVQFLTNCMIFTAFYGAINGLKVRGYVVLEIIRKPERIEYTDKYYMESESIRNGRKYVGSIVWRLNTFGRNGRNVKYIAWHAVICWYLLVPTRFCPVFDVFRYFVSYYFQVIWCNCGNIDTKFVAAFIIFFSFKLIYNL